jgi:hypothetical protein
VANPCPPYDDQNNFGPYRVAFNVVTPGGWVDNTVSDSVTGQAVSSQLTDALKTGFNALAAPITANLRGVWLETVQCGTVPRVYFGQLLDNVVGTPTWIVEVNEWAPNGLSKYPLDHPWVARMWMDTLDTVPLPAGAGNATLTPGLVAYPNVEGKYTDTLPANYDVLVPGTVQPGVPMVTYDPVNYIRRSTNKSTTATTSATAQPIFTVRAKLLAGRRYRIAGRGALYHSAATAAGQVEFHYTTNDVEPTTASPILFREIVTFASSAVTGVPDGFTWDYFPYDATTDHTLRLMATMHTALGTGTLTFESTAGPSPGDMVIQDCGLTAAASGTVY